MPNDIRLRVANASATVTLNATDQQVQAALTRYARSLGIPITGVAVDDLTSVINHWVDDVRRRSKAVEISDALAAAQVTAQQQADADNAL